MESKERSFLQSLILALLVILMLTQCTIYINLAENIDNTGLPLFPESEMELLTDKKSNSSISEHFLIMPYFFAAAENGSKYAYEYDNFENERIWECFIDVLESSPGGTVKKVSFAQQEEKYAYLKQLYLDSDNYFYVKFKDEFQLSVLCALLIPENDAAFQNEDFGISDMFLFSGSGGEAYITAVSKDGNVLKIFPSRNISFNKELLSEYTDTEQKDFEFVRVSVNEQNGVNCYFPAFRHSVSLSDIVLKSYSEIENIETTPSVFTEIFGMNEDNIKTYSALNGASVYVQDATRLTVSQEGNVEFQPEYGETELSDILNSGNNTKYSFSDITKAAFKIAGEVNNILDNFTGKLMLTDIIYSNGIFRFYYNYNIYGIPINNGEKYGLYLEFSDRALLYGAVNVRPYIFSEDSNSADMSQKSAYALLENSIETSVSYFGAEYKVKKGQNSDDNASMLWTVKTERKENK